MSIADFLKLLTTLGPLLLKLLEAFGKMSIEQQEEVIQQLQAAIPPPENPRID